MDWSAFAEREVERASVARKTETEMIFYDEFLMAAEGDLQEALK